MCHSPPGGKVLWCTDIPNDLELDRLHLTGRHDMGVQVEIQVGSAALDGGKGESTPAALAGAQIAAAGGRQSL